MDLDTAAVAATTANNNNANTNESNANIRNQQQLNRSTCLKSSYDTDVIRIIGQHLVSLGLNQTVNLLLEETGLHGLDHPIATKIQHHILAGDWDKANSLVDDIADLIVSTQQKEKHEQQHQLQSQQQQQSQDEPQIDLERQSYANQIRLLIAEQKFLEFIEDSQYLKALKCLRLEITPRCEDTKYVQNLATILMCKSPEEIRLRANWPGKGQLSRQMLIEKLQRFIPPMIMLPPKRLNILLGQAVQLQKDRCPLHLGDNPSDNDDDGINKSTDKNNPPTPMSGLVMATQSNGTTFTSYLQTNMPAATATQLVSNGSHLAAASTYVDLKTDHLCSADKFPLSLRQECENHMSEVWYCAFSNDGTKLATGGLGGRVKIWSVDTRDRQLTEECTFDCGSHSITCLSWSPNDVYLLSCGSEDRPDLILWNVAKREQHNKIPYTDDEHWSTCSWHSSGVKFAAASIKGNFVIFDLDSNRKGAREGVRVQCLSFLNKDPSWILAADTLNRIRAYAIKEMSLDTDEEHILEERYPIMSFTIDRDDKYIAANIFEQGVHLWDYNNKTLLRTFPDVCQRNLAIYSSFSSAHSSFLASGSEDGKVYIYHVNRDEPVAILEGNYRSVNCVSWNPRYPELLVSVSDDRFVRLWAPITNDGNSVLKSHGSTTTRGGGGGGINGNNNSSNDNSRQSASISRSSLVRCRAARPFCLDQS